MVTSLYFCAIIETLFKLNLNKNEITRTFILPTYCFTKYFL